MGFNKTLGQAFIIILLAIASYQLLHENNHTTSTALKLEKDQTEKPSAFISNGEFTIYDKKGHPTNFLSKKARYYSNPKRILIDTPFISFTTEDNQVITLNAKKGTFHPTEEKLTLTGNVIIQRLPPTHPNALTFSSGNAESPPDNAVDQYETWTLKSEGFELNNQTHFISTDQAVTMTKGESSVRAVGLNAWINERKIELLSEVQGHYVFN